MDAIKVMIVDDSVFYRGILSEILKQIPQTELVDSASNGKLALCKLRINPADVVFLDIEMPVMDGLETLECIKKEFPDTEVVMVSSYNRFDAGITIKCLEKGALDFISKPDTKAPDENIQILRDYLLPLFRHIVVRRSFKKLKTGEIKPPIAPVHDASNDTMTAAFPHISPTGFNFKKVDAICIGSSTGGPNALMKIIPALPKIIHVPIYIVQHMPPMFTASLADVLNEKSALTVVEAKEGDMARENKVYIAPGGKHMEVHKAFDAEKRTFGYTISLNMDPPVCSCRPSVNVLFHSIAKAYQNNVLSVILTGMGDDGTEGVGALNMGNNYCITQSEASCEIPSMPRSVNRRKFADEQVPLDDIANRIVCLLQRHYQVSWKS